MTPRDPRRTFPVAAHIGNAPPAHCLRRPNASPLTLLLGLAGCVLAPMPSALAQAIADGARSGGASSVSTLPSITVQEQRAAATDTYAGGQVATGGRVGLLGDKDFMDTPFSTISYTDAFIEDRQARDITDVIAATDPSVFSNGVTGAWSENFWIRGYASSTSDMTINGLFGMAPYYRTSPEMFERIEVLKGPSALLNGMPPGGSVGGAVNLIPKRAGSQPLTRISANYASGAQFGGHLDAGRRLGSDQQFGIRFNAAYRDGEGAVRRQDKTVQLGALGLDWRGERTRLFADLYRADDTVHGPARGVGLAAGLAVPRPPRNDVLINPDWAIVESRDKGAIVRGEVDLNDRIMAYAAYGISETNYQYNGSISALILNEAGDFRTTIGQLAFDLKKQSAAIGVQGKHATGSVGHQWAVNATHYAHEQDDYGRRSVPGADWVTNLYHPVWGPAAPFVAPHISHTELRLDSIGIADTMSFAADRLQVTLGVRRQQVVSDTFSVATGARTSRYDESATTPAAALLLKFSSTVAGYANYIEGLSQGATAPMTAANAGDVFAPYKTRQKELGLKVDLGRFAHTFSLFQITRPSSYADPVTNVFSFGGEQRNRGLEWGFFGAPVDGVRLMGGVSVVDPKVTRTLDARNQGKAATGVPKQQGKVGAEWDVPGVQGVTVTANATAVSKQYISADNTLWAAGRTLYDVGARYATTVADTSVTLRAAVNNLTNKAYWGMPLLSSLAQGAPRTYLLSATVDF